MMRKVTEKGVTLTAGPGPAGGTTVTELTRTRDSDADHESLSGRHCQAPGGPGPGQPGPRAPGALPEQGRDAGAAQVLSLSRTQSGSRYQPGPNPACPGPRLRLR